VVGLHRVADLVGDEVAVAAVGPQVAARIDRHLEHFVGEDRGDAVGAGERVGALVELGLAPTTPDWIAPTSVVVAEGLRVVGGVDEHDHPRPGAGLRVKVTWCGAGSRRVRRRGASGG
jgi:hypothetical protein